ncbi:hypothetical protein G7K_0834-t1 [Saitoella complicata NRRL Y-17804]|uniref:Uncharacterized protein n=1 Tax=Saitoella complicata (strain BCRC 22490 / CBS 7301 / JCM 7358 / NBRC 10748 / NRRL Y-17804) TaxID=698492 RepID=A0A0E9N9P1_SAICN|nr:hypothetical protein G7K_0834-t1 [Saitoella complicata NRRL Y-17804]
MEPRGGESSLILGARAPASLPMDHDPYTMAHTKHAKCMAATRRDVQRIKYSALTSSLSQQLRPQERFLIHGTRGGGKAQQAQHFADLSRSGSGYGYGYEREAPFVPSDRIATSIFCLVLGDKAH